MVSLLFDLTDFGDEDATTAPLDPTTEALTAFTSFSETGNPHSESDDGAGEFEIRSAVTIVCKLADSSSSNFPVLVDFVYSGGLLL